ncbi:MAG: methylmalonyl Co-A mutase-associated GTPase MeaB [Bacteroidales bacterium]|nr:methylmalonyl Co-A mutase-associated GTPase MeaB [Bacteroidales bacterium]
MDKGNKHKSALSVQAGVEPPSQVNAEAIRNLKSRKSSFLSTPQYLEGIFEGNRTILSKAITLIESSRSDHQAQAQEIISECLKTPKGDLLPPLQGRAGEGLSGIRIGITGVPGVGKSTFIEALGKHVTGLGHKLAVLAVDPSSTISKGSILGDKTRMESLAIDPNAFIRPSASSGSLGGVARKTRETIYLCEAAGFDVVFVETVGVGQSETVVKSMVDFFLLLMLAGAGDELQGIKRGIIEMADALIINKADGDNLKKAKIAAMDYTKAVHLFPPSHTGWIPVVDLCSAKTHEGVPKIWEIILAFQTTMLQHGHFQRNRMSQNRQVFHQAIEEKLADQFYTHPGIRKQLLELEKQVTSGSLNPYQAVNSLFADR